MRSIRERGHKVNRFTNAGPRESTYSYSRWTCKRIFDCSRILHLGRYSTQREINCLSHENKSSRLVIVFMFIS